MMMKASVLIAFFAAAVRAFEVTAPSCIDIGSDVTINFNSTRPKNGDWIGLMPVTGDELTSGVAEPLNRNWIWTCGSQSCESSPSTGTVKLLAPTVTDDNRYIAYLARNGVEPYRVKAVSGVINVKISCSQSTSAPLAQPTPSPHVPTSSAAHSIPDTVGTTKTLYSSGDSITVKFTSKAPARGDWVAIFDADTTLDSQEEPHSWHWAGCDRQDDEEGCPAMVLGTVVFADGKDIDWRTKWPLPPGKYVAALLRDDGESPWDVITTSAPFSVTKPPFGPAYVTMVRREIKEIIREDIKLAAKFLRMAFHDSVGGADGCIDLSNIHNRGLLEPMKALRPVVNAHKAFLTRGDVWFLAALEGARVSQDSDANFHGDFDFTEYGRINCEEQQTICRNEEGVIHPCIPARGPHREIPGSNANTHELYSFFKEQYNFDQKEVVAIMGAHTIGSLSRENSGIDGENGWVLDNRLLDNGYYFELVGGFSRASVNTLVNNAPNWKRFFERQEPGSDFDDIGIWHGLPEGSTGRVVVMLNADFSIIRNFTSKNLDPETGKVKCQFVERSGDDPVCPHVEGAIQQAGVYKSNNELWIRDLEKVLRKMANAKYEITSDCIQGLCKLAKA